MTTTSPTIADVMPPAALVMVDRMVANYLTPLAEPIPYPYNTRHELCKIYIAEFGWGGQDDTCDYLIGNALAAAGALR